MEDPSSAVILHFLKNKTIKFSLPCPFIPRHFQICATCASQTWLLRRVNSTHWPTVTRTTRQRVSRRLQTRFSQSVKSQESTWTWRPGLSRTNRGLRCTKPMSKCWVWNTLRYWYLGAYNWCWYGLISTRSTEKKGGNNVIHLNRPVETCSWPKKRVEFAAHLFNWFYIIKGRFKETIFCCFHC